MIEFSESYKNIMQIFEKQPPKKQTPKNTNQYGTNTRTDQNESFSKLKHQTENGDMGDSS